MGTYSTSQFEFPVVFVAERLPSRWRELLDSRHVPSIASFSSTRFLVLEDIWIVSTYLRLRDAGLRVEIDSSPRADAVNVVCSSKILLRSLPARCVIVSIRADRAAQTWGDLNLVQNPLNLKSPTDWLIDHWPQPNIIPRDSARGDRVERVGVIGPKSSIAAEIRDSKFESCLRSLGFELVIRSDGTSWNDYSDLDVQLAFRPGPKALLRCKPATKIVQSWIAGCPAITGIEPCFRTVGRPGIDYLEASSASEIIAHLRSLRSRPDFYRSLIDRGGLRARSHDEAAVIRQWVAFLNGPASSVLRRRLSGTTPVKSRLLRRSSVITSAVRHRLLMSWVRLHGRVRELFLSRSTMDEPSTPCL